MSIQNDIALTFFGLVICAAISIFCFRRNFAEHNELEPRMVPWMVICLAALATGFMLVVHLVNLLGITTGRS